MACFTTLPFDIHVLVIEQLSLKDCLAYMQVCTITHGCCVSYLCSYNFHSVLDNNNTIALPPEMLMNVLYAHAKAETIIFVLIPHQFVQRLY